MNRPAYPNDPTALVSANTEAADPYSLDLVSQIGSEVAGALSSALERVNALSATGLIDRSGLRSLRDEIERARRAGMLGQQVSRIASGRVPITEERMDLTAQFREALNQRGREVEARSIELHLVLGPAEVCSDPTLVFGLLQSVLDWSFEHACSRIDLMVEVRNWPPFAHLICGFAHRPADEVRADSVPSVAARIDTMSWQLLKLTASILGLKLERHDTADRTLLTVAFPKTLGTAAAVEHLLPLDLDDRRAGAHNSKPLAGSHVLVVASRRDVRTRIREVLLPMGLMIDFVGSINEAREFCSGGLPHAIVYEAQLGGARVEQLQAELLAEAPTLAFIQIVEQGKAYEVINQGGRELSSVALDALSEALPSAMLFELSRRG